MLTSEGKYNYNAFLLADENNVSIKLVKYLDTNKMDLVENQEYGYRCLITATQKILDRLDTENTVYAKIEYKGRKEVEKIDSKALKEAVINAIVHNDYKFMDHFLRVSFKYKENPFEYDDTAKTKSRNQKYIIK